MYILLFVKCFNTCHTPTYNSDDQFLSIFNCTYGWSIDGDYGQALFPSPKVALMCLLSL